MNLNKNKHLCITIILILSFILSAVGFCFADSPKPFDPKKICSLTLHYADGTDPIPGMEIEITKVANTDSDAYFTWISLFSSYNITNVNFMKSQSEWKDLADTITAYVIADKIAPTQMQITDENGVVKFTGLETGLYYVRWNGNAISAVYGFDPFMITLPSLNVENEWEYDVDAIPKPGGNMEDDIHDTYSAVKEWADKGSLKRPVSIEIEIYCDDELFQTVELNADNNWRCIWGSEGTHQWNVVEKTVPENYTVSVSKNETAFIITNTLKDVPPDDPPYTGDISNISLWMYLTAASGVVMIVLFLFRRKDEDE